MVKPDKANAKDLFETKRRYDIPPFQRPYVWNAEDQWVPLWDAVVRVAESHLVARSSRPVGTHFMGAIVVELTEATSAGVDRFDVIDGQQRLTTMQLLLDAVEKVLTELGHEDEADSLRELTKNDKPRFAGTTDRFKLWPSRADRTAFAHAMDPSEPKPPSESQILGAHDFFSREARRWLSGEPDEHGDRPPGSEAARAEQLCETIARRLMVVTIDLSDEDDPQLIFETLNDRGTPLLRADLIKNWIFRKGKLLDADVEKWAATIWDDFDTEWWRAEISQGRTSRSRVDVFLQYWLTMRTLDVVKSERVFVQFTAHADERMSDVASAEDFLLELRRDANTYRDLVDLGVETAPGRFRAQVIEAMELAATMPVLLWFISDNHEVPGEQIEIGLGALESWATRRTLLRLTSKDVNRLMVALLKELRDVDPARAGHALRELLSEQTANSRFWPSDEALREGLPSSRVYGVINQRRLRTILGHIEMLRRGRSTMHEQVPVPSGLSVEHIMPRGWRDFWDSEPRLEGQDAQERDVLVNSIGNLTVITQPLNSSLSNRPWVDADAAELKAGGHAGKGKRSLLQQFSLLVINKEIVDEHADHWSEDDIIERGRALTDDIIEIWPGPDVEIQSEAFEKTRDGRDLA